ncbi:DUF416 family protein [Lysobacter sp. CA199]|uniref:DUF416 family protein n=1 Tax=Lysobacter sp. CA199 TaxID=3455608 RepID=UPI003F8D32E5
MIGDFRAEVVRKLSGAPNWKRVAFMAFCAEPCVANYRLYRRAYNRGSIKALRESLDVVWDSTALPEWKRHSAAVIERPYQQPPARKWIRPMSPLEESAYYGCAAIGYCLDDTGHMDDVEAVAEVALFAIIAGLGGSLAMIDNGQPENIKRLVEQEIDRLRSCLDGLSEATEDSRDSIVSTLREEGRNARPSIVYASPLDYADAQLVHKETDAIEREPSEYAR